jgi:hypothetical protein
MMMTEILEVISMKSILWMALLTCGTQLFAQTAVPAGTILPVALSSSLNSRKSKAGQVITARIMQNVPLATGSQLRAGTKVLGRVVEVSPADGTHGATMSLRFDTLVVSKRQIPITTDVRAFASMMAVHEAGLPETGPDRGTSQNAWTTDQIGGDVVYRGGGPVANGLLTVGEPTADGVLAQVSPPPGAKCRGEIGDAARLQALWVFSSDACGTYDLPHITMAHAGRTNPEGEVTLTSDKGDINIRVGSGALLRVNSKLGGF